MEIHWSHLKDLRPDDVKSIEARLQELALGHTDLIDVHVSAKPTGHHRHGGQEVRITGQARGKEIVAARTRADVGLALNEALDAFERELRKLRARRLDERSERPAAPPVLGVIDRVLREQGYGFILSDAGEKVYFHRNAVHGGLRFEELEEGQRVGLNVEPGDQGLQANAVVPAPPGTPSP